ASSDVARVTEVRLRASRLLLSGTTARERLTLHLGPTTHALVPQAGSQTFHADLPFQTGPITLRCAQGTALTLPGFTDGDIRRARRVLALRYVWDLIVLLPVTWTWKVKGDLGAREVVKEALKLVNRPAAALLDAQALIPPDRPKQTGPATLIMPVHNAPHLVSEALDRVARHSGDRWRMILIDDASTDPAVRPLLQEWADGQGDRVTLLLQDRNLGFVGSVNRGFEVAQAWPDDPVVLLNSDAMVPAGWLPRLLTPLAEPDVASVTPLSNDAEICTVPKLCAPHGLLPGQGDALDAAAQTLAPGAPRPTLPTGVGFCMAMAPRFLAQIPRFDPAFGAGYGEEVDWCRKAMARGGRHVCAQDLFVEHRGGASFGSATKQRLLEKNGAEVARRYPRFEAEVQSFLANDPLTTPRLALGLSWAALSGEVPVYLAHALGGGAEDWLQRHLTHHQTHGPPAVVLRVGQGRRWRIELYGPQGVTAGLTDDIAMVEALLARLPKRRIVYSCGVGDADPAALPDALLRLAGPDAPLEVLFHDFFPISPSYTLLARDGFFHGVPVAGGTADAAHTHRTPSGKHTDLAQWQAAWGRLMDRATSATVFSRDSQAHVLRVYPQLAPVLRCMPHSLQQTPPPLDRPHGPTPVIGVLGNIGAHKGAGILQALSRQMAEDGTAKLVILGHLAPEFSVAAPSQIHGAYRLADLPTLVKRYGIQAWFIPSIWPETFSFTTHEVLATGLPVAAFDLGAQGEAVRAAIADGAPGLVLPLPDAQKPVNLTPFVTLITAADKTTT
ncbi:MAG: glycosyltransferase, partial [Pseudomonadota bacterium]